MPTNYDKLRTLLRELFQMDQADLDFGLYRIMNAKRGEIERFLEHDLLPQVKSELARHTTLDSSAKQAELAAAIEGAQKLGMNPDDVRKVQELRAQLKQGGDLDSLENEVFSHLYNFFRRYYHQGDFLSLRRYKEGVYGIPYEGEEVKLYWANHDQYYIKSTEYLRNYTFKLRDNRRVHFKVVEADTEADNNKSQGGKERRFILAEAAPVAVENGELFIRFHYQADARKQTELNASSVAAVLGNPALMDWLAELGDLRPTEKKPDRTLLAKHLDDFTARFTFDYFIHKDLGGFLRRELDFFIKNEIMHLDDVEGEAAPKVELYLSKIKALRKIAHKFIAFLEQLENFQKRLWLKKKFVVETNYCVTLDRVPEALYPEIAANEAQRAEWVSLFAIDEIKASTPAPAPAQGELIAAKALPPTPGYSVPLTVGFLKANPYLVLDTKFFSPAFTVKLLADIKVLGGALTLDEATDGLLVNADNFQALNLMQSRCAAVMKCIYIDPPYNTGGDGFAFKDDYQHSCWASMMDDRLKLARPLLKPSGVFFASIDAKERALLELLLTQIFGRNNRVEELIWVQNSTKNQSPTYSTNHEYVEVFARDLPVVRADANTFREPKPGCAELMALVEGLNPSYPSLAEVEDAIAKLFDQHRAELRAALEAADVANDKGLDPWKGLYNYNRAEYRDSAGRYLTEEVAKASGGIIRVWREGDPSMPQVKEDSQKAEFRDPNDPTFRFYKPPHPVTGQPCPHPKTGWRWPLLPHGAQANCFSGLAADERIVWGKDECKIPQVKRFLHETETNVAKSVVSDFTDGEKQLSDLFGKSRMFGGPKPTTLIERFIQQTTSPGDTVCDFFGGSGTTGQAVISFDHHGKGRRRFMLVEVGSHFDTILKPRIQKCIYSKDWDNGVPVSRQGLSLVFKYIRLESYEDCLNNLELKRTPAQDDLLAEAKDFREDYTLRYMLDVETRGSASLLNVQQFTDPFNYQLKVSTGTVGETKAVKVDLVETFNWLVGLTVHSMSVEPVGATAYARVKGKTPDGDKLPSVLVVEGVNPQSEKVIILWRNGVEMDNDLLDEWFRRKLQSPRTGDFDLIYVNGDNHLENLRRPDQTWKVRSIEEDFHRLMWECQDV